MSKGLFQAVLISVASTIAAHYIIKYLEEKRKQRLNEKNDTI